MGEQAGATATGVVKLTWRPAAIADLNALLSIIAQEQPAAAERVAGRVLSTAELLSEYPHLGRVRNATLTRELAVAHTPYLLIYRVTDETVVVLRVLHGAQFRP
jgi:plasmid stabilization system protein ParE